MAYACQQLALAAVAFPNADKYNIANRAINTNDQNIVCPKVMIGTDYFWDLVQGPLEKLPSGFGLSQVSLVLC